MITLEPCYSRQPFCNGKLHKDVLADKKCISLTPEKIWKNQIGEAIKSA